MTVVSTVDGAGFSQQKGIGRWCGRFGLTLSDIRIRISAFAPDAQRAARRAPDSEHRMPIIYAILAVLLALVTSAGAQQAQPATQPATQPNDATWGPSPAEFSPDAVRAKLKALEADTERGPAVKATLLDLYTKALHQLGQIEEWRARRAQFEKARLDAPAAITALRDRLAAAASQPATAPGVTSAPELTLAVAQQKLSEAESELAALQQDRNRLVEQEKAWGERRQAIPDLLARLAQQSKVPAADVGPPPAEADSAEVALARLQLDTLRRQAMDEESAGYREELRSYDARSELLALRRDQANIDLLAAEQRLKSLQQVVNDLRRAEAERQAEEARRKAESAPRAVRELAEQNVAFADERAKLAAKAEALAAELEVVRQRVKRLTAEFAQIQNKVEKAGLTDLIGQQLRRQRSQLPDARAAQQRVAALKREYGEVGLREIEVEALRQNVLDLEAAVRDMTASLASETSETQRTVIADKVRESLAARRELTQVLEGDYEKYGQSLLVTKGELEKEIAHVGEVQRFIDQKVLWIRSDDPIVGMRARVDWRALPGGWSETVGAFVDDSFANPTLYVSAAMLLVLLIVVRVRIQRQLHEISQRVSGAFTDSFRLTIQAAVESALVAAIIPACLWFASWRLRIASGATGTPLAVAEGLDGSAYVLLLVQLLLAVCLPKGLAECHFRWRPETCRRLRAQLRLVAVVGPPLRFVIGCAAAGGDDSWNSLVGRGAFLCVMLLLAYVAQRLLRSEGGAIENVLKRNPDGWLNYTRYVWYPIAVGMPIVLGVAAAAGYYYAALELHRRVMSTVWMGLGLLMAHAVLVRWLFVAHRKLALVQLRKKRAEQARQVDANEPATELPPLVESDEPPDFMLISVQTRKLTSAAVALTLALGTYGIWVDILPAFSFVGDIHLWSHTVQVAQDSTAGGDARVRTQVVPVTLADLALAATVVIVTVILSRNIPGLLEITILSRLPLEPAGRYAVTTVSRYVLTIIGAVVAFGAVGVGWTEVQWLAAAITVGLGFGLQEIFANFVSGLIILFERPIRVGDTVTIGGTSGTVTKIRIRATTILDWDRKELIVPNREFITGQVINWTLSDTLTRVVIPVGVAYGSDPEQVRAALLHAARDCALIADAPAPAALFKEFGASSLDFELRAFVRSPDDALLARHQLLVAIAAELSRLSIAIAFPQLDVHVHDVPPRAAIQP